MTGMLPGPNLIVEYYEKPNTKKKAELILYDIGVGVKYDATSKVKPDKGEDKKEKLHSSIPPVPYSLFASDYLENGTYLGKPASCEEGDAIDKIKRSVCQYITVQPINRNGKKDIQFVAKTAVSIGSMDLEDCNVYLFTVGHVIWSLDSAINEDFTVVRYNWIRKKPDYPGCKYPNTLDSAQWEATIELDSVVDYCGTELLVYFPNGRDLALMKLVSKPIHNIYLSGWNAQNEICDTNSWILSNNGPMRFSYCKLNSGCSFDSLPDIYIETGVSGSTAFQYINNNYSVFGSLPGGNCINRLSYGFENPGIKFKEYLNPDSIYPRICMGREYNNPLCGESHCCEHYFAEIQGNDPEKDGAWRAKSVDNECCANLVIEERLYNSITCPEYLIDIYKNGILEYPEILVDFDTLPNKIYTLEQCIILNPDEPFRVNRYKIVYKDLDSNAIDSCEKELVFLCSRPCEVNEDSYSISLQPQVINELIDTCCYEAVIVRKTSNACDVNAIIPYVLEIKEEKYTQSFAYVNNSSLFQNSDTLIINDICLKTRKYSKIFFDFYQFVEFNPDSTLIDYWFNQRINKASADVPNFCSLCCENYEIEAHLTNCDLSYEISNHNINNCSWDSVQIDTYFFKNSEYIFIDNILKDNGNIFIIPDSSKILNPTSNNGVFYRFTFYDSLGNIICYKHFSAPTCSNTGYIDYSPLTDCCQYIMIYNAIGAINYITKARVLKQEFNPATGTFEYRPFPDNITYYDDVQVVYICADDKYSTYYIEFIDLETDRILYKIPILLNCPCCSEESLNFNVLGPDTNCCYTFNLNESYGTSSCYSVKWVKYSRVGETNDPETCSPDDLTNLNLCNDSEELQQYYFEFFTDEILSDSSKRICYKVVDLEGCVDCCEDEDITFDVIGPDTNCCFTFLFNQIINNNCSPINYFSVKLENDSNAIHQSYITNPYFPNYGIHSYQICNSELNTFRYVFEFYSDNTYSENSKVCSRLIELQSCADTATFCCNRTHFNIELEKGGGNCGDDSCFVTQTWDIPENLDCFKFYQYNQTMGPFDTLFPPLLNIGPCIPVGTSIIDSVALLRYPNDPDPCYVKFEAYCTVGDVSRGCEPDDCDSTWEYESLSKTIDSGDCAGCKLTIYYRHRNTCGSWQDLQILYIEKKTDNYWIDPCACSREEIYNMALKMVVGQNDMEFEPKWSTILQGGDSCNIQWRISQISCWTDWEFDQSMQVMGRGKKPNPQDGETNPEWGKITVYEPCNETCCARQVKVCRYASDSVSIENYAIISDNNNCDTVTWRNLDCYFTCDFFDNNQNPIIPPFEDDVTLDIFDNGTINIFHNDSLNIFYDNSIFKVIYTQTFVNCNISIFNLLGNLVVNNENIISIRANTIEVDISRLPSGVYIFNVTNDNVSIVSGKINIIR
jgi:hypothetical protein